MKYSEIIESNEQLKESVLCYWQMTGIADIDNGVSSRHIPKGQNMLIFNFGDQIEHTGLLQNNLSKFSYFIVPALKTSLILNQKGKIDLFGVSFLSDGLYKLIQMPVSELIGDIPERLRSKLDDLYSRLKGTSLMEKKGIVATFILEHISRNIKSITLNRAIEIINTSKGVVKVNEIAGQLLVSERQIQRLFMTRIGITPKDYCKIVRVNNYLEFILTKKTKIDFMELVVEYNYHDQPHLINEVKSISKLPPKKLLSYRDTLYDRYSF